MQNPNPLSDQQWEELLKDIPAGMSIKELYQLMSKRDPLVWCAFNRKVKGTRLTYDVSEKLTPEAIAKLRTECETDKEFNGELKLRHLAHRPFLIQPLRDDHPIKDYMKARQLGVSELSFSETAEFLINSKEGENRKAVTTFPRERQLITFSNSRINVMFSETPRTERMKGLNAVFEKRIGNGFLFLRSAWDSALGEGVDADMVTLDEYDRMKEGIENAFTESLEGSKYSLLRALSTPTLPTRGIAKRFRDTDQQHWLVKCSSGHEQKVTLKENIQQIKEIPKDAKGVPEGSYAYKCYLSKCGADLDRLKGRWEADYPSHASNARGYHMSQLIAGWISASRIMHKKWRFRSFPQLFVNYVLGLASQHDSVMLTMDNFERICAGFRPIKRRTKDWSLISVGIDWGAQNWVTIYGMNAAQEFPYVINAACFEDSKVHELDSVKDIDSFIAPYKPNIIVADHGFGRDRNLYLKRKYATEASQPCPFFACFYTGENGKAGSRNISPVWSASGQVNVDRTSSLKTMARAVRDAEFGIADLDELCASPDGQMLMREIAKHCCNLVPMRHIEGGDDNEDSDEIDTATVVEEISKIGPDHLANALNYARLGMEYLIENGTGSFNYSFD